MVLPFRPSSSGDRVQGSRVRVLLGRIFKKTRALGVQRPIALLVVEFVLDQLLKE